MIRAWLKRRAEAKHAERHQQGFDWAAGCLLRGFRVEQVKTWAEYGTDFDGPNPWYQGIADACKAWERK